MQNLTQPRWLLLVHTLPVAVLLGLGYSEYSVIETLLPLPSQHLWQELAGVVAALLLATAGYAAWQQRQGRRLAGAYALFALVAHVAVLWRATSQEGVLVPPDVPQWMLPSPPLLLAFTFLMPVMVHALFVLVAQFTPTERPHNAGFNFLLAFILPALWYCLLVLPNAWWDQPEGPVLQYLLAAALILSTFSFLFFLVRGLYILGLQKSTDTEWSLIWKMLVALVLPLLGLAVNNGLLSSLINNSTSDTGVFGNFNSLWFYGLALLNGVLLCVSGGTQPGYRLLLLLGRSITLAYTLYFFLVFLPFLPLSILAVIAVGVGVLMLTPLLLFVLHVQELSADYHFLQPYFPRWQLRAVVVAGALVLPLSITASYWHQRQVLHAALHYLYSPDYSQTPHLLDETALARTLAVVRQHKDRNGDFVFGHQQPYLSMCFNWLVLDNLTLSEEKISTMEQVFLGTPKPEQPAQDWAAPETPRATLRNFTVRSTYNRRQQAWESWLHLVVANPAGPGTLPAREYATELELPTGCWINGYYLDMDGRREAGILAEKKAAHWVFSQIVNTNRDPGILHYLSGNRVALRVFPVSGTKARTTGIRFTHKEPVTLAFDGRRVLLGDTTTAPPTTATITTPDKAVAYVSAAAKQRLPLVRRRPYYHFLLDVSQGSEFRKTAYAQQVKALLAAQPLPAPPRFSFVNAYTTPVAATEWEAQLAQTSPAGGLYLDGAIRRALADTWQHPAGTYPVLVVVTDDLPKAVLPQDFADLHSAYPEAPWFYQLGPDGRLQPHDLRRNPRDIVVEAAAPGRASLVRAWPSAQVPVAYLPDNQQADIVLNTSALKVQEAGSGATTWQTGLLLHGYSQWQTLHPETTDAERVPAIRASFRAGIMTPFTSYLALENDAQKAALRRKQQQTLNGNAALDAGEDTPPADVPIDGGASLLLAAGAGLGLRQLHRRRKSR